MSSPSRTVQIEEIPDPDAGGFNHPNTFDTEEYEIDIAHSNLFEKQASRSSHGM